MDIPGIVPADGLGYVRPVIGHKLAFVACKQVAVDTVHLVCADAVPQPWSLIQCGCTEFPILPRQQPVTKKVLDYNQFIIQSLVYGL